ncbi:MAG TPA: phosphoribosylformylglycinamidine synthase I [Phycisphaerae bacterium]|nr:phosphoribosylformylglycinamidine synthase I [Phycisphaerae bacterium]
MAKPKALVLRTAGTNCDRETQFALEKAGFAAERVHVYRLMERPAALREYQFLVIPGGFSYGDDVGGGKILANQMLHALADELNAFIAADKLILGICNGFQVMVKSGLLPWGRVEPGEAHRDATLAWNTSGRFEDRWVHLKAASDKCVFLPPGEIIALPIAHGEGRFVPRDERVLARLREGDQIALAYVDADGNIGGYPINPNGSVADVAGLCDPTGRILGLMPHPERFMHVTQHPRWTGQKVNRPDGMLLFQRAAEYYA